MNAGSVFFAFLALFGLFAGYLLYEPVPDGITEPAKYRTFMALGKFKKLLIRIAHLAHRDEPFESYCIKISQYLTKMAPEPPGKVEGSNIRSKVIKLGGVNARAYQPIKRRSPDLMAAFIYIHGGGTCLGSADSYDGLTRKIAEELDTVVVSIDYRLAPSHPAPVCHEDCVAATRAFMQRAESDFHVDYRRIGIGGDSAGGHLSASVANEIHGDPSLPDLKLQILIYPSMQKIDLNTPSYQKYRADFGDHAGVLPLPFRVAIMGLSYLGKTDPEFVENVMKNNHTSSEFKMTSREYTYVNHEQIPVRFRDPRYYKTRNDPRTGNAALWKRISPRVLDPRSNPLMRHDLQGVPPAFILTAGFDTFRDDGIFYRNRLMEADVPVKWTHYEEAFHGVLWVGGSFNFAVGDAMRKDIIDYFKENI